MIMPPSARKALRNLGEGIAMARKKRRISTASMAERAEIARATLSKIEKGDPSVTLGNYLSVLSILGLESRLGEIASAERDEMGLTLDAFRSESGRKRAACMDKIVILRPPLATRTHRLGTVYMHLRSGKE